MAFVQQQSSALHCFCHLGRCDVAVDTINNQKTSNQTLWTLSHPLNSSAEHQEERQMGQGF
jgi:hypothetical protein